jgi:glycosyltransferase involved in cell wall biosynthesis
VIEAGITGLPVVAHAVGGVPELIVDGVTGLLCPRGDVRALATAVLRLLDDRDARRTMGAAARERCLDLYDIEAVAPRYLSVYQDVIAGRPGRLASLLVAGTPSDGKGGS